MPAHPARTGPEATKSSTEILEGQLQHGLKELRRPASGLIVSGFSAGLDLGFSLLVMAVMATLTHDVFPRPVVEILLANLYSLGFIFVVLGRSELFTEHTTLAVLPVFHGEAGLKALARLWVLIYFSNLTGATLFALLTSWIGPALGVIDPSVFGEIGRRMVHDSAPVILVSGILAGWLMGILSWLVSASRDTISQVVVVWLITFAIGISGLHHSILGTVEVLAAVFSSQGVSMGDYFHFIVWATLGNAIGGAVFVGAVKYTHATRA